MKKKDENYHRQQAEDEPKEQTENEEVKETSAVPEETLEKKQADYDALWDKYLRLQAEFDNYKKRSYKEKLEFIKFANEGLILELLEILDNFERGIKAADQKKDFVLLHQGVDLISKQLHNLLEDKGLKRIKSIGEKFDPHQHEAVEVIEDEQVSDDLIIDELQAGYALNGRIIRSAKVKVAKKKPETSNQKTEAKNQEPQIKTEREEKTKED